MAADSALRRLLKRTLRPVLRDGSYRYVQALAKAWDIRTGSWSEPELELLPMAIRPGETVLDIGANFGLYCYHMSRAVGDGGRVLAFEPIPFNVATLRLVLRFLRIRNVRLYDRGVSDHAGPLVFNVPLSAVGTLSSGLSHAATRNDDHPGKETQVRWKATKAIESSVVRLDEEIVDVAALSCIKCDIEGGELLAFRGAEQLITRHLPSVICEINPWYIEGFGLRLEDLTSFFWSRGYGLYFYDSARNRGLRKIKNAADVVEDNYIFIHPKYLPRFESCLERPGP